MNPQIQQILDTIPVAGLATINADGSPWATPIHFTHDNQYLYWFSKSSTTHSTNIGRDSRVSLTIWSPDESQGLAGVYLLSQAQQTSDRQAAEEAYLAKFGEIPEVFTTYAVYLAPLGQINSVKSNGQLWYLVGNQ